MAVSALRSAVIKALGGTVELPVAATEQKSSLAEPTAETFAMFGAMPSAAGVSVTPETAMRCAPVRAAVLAIAEAVGQLPLHVFRRLDDGGKERDRDHPVARLVGDVANEWTTSAHLREAVTLDALLFGAGYCEITRLGDGRTAELHRLDPRSVTEKFLNDGSPIYEVRGPGKSTRLVARGDMLHLRAPGGRSPILDGREAIGVALQLERHAAQLFANGGRPGGTLSFPADVRVDGEAVKRVGAAWNAAHGGSRTGATAILTDGVTYSQVAFSSVDAQFLEIWNRAVLEIARVFRVPPAMLQDYERGTWSNTEQMALNFLTYALAPWLKRWEGEVRLKLFSPKDRDNYVVEFLTDDLLRSDYATRTEGYAKLIAARVMTANEVRQRENLPRHPDGDALVNPNTTAGDAGEGETRFASEGSTDA